MTETTSRIPLASMLVRLLVLIALIGAFLFVPAGRLDWPQAWAFLAAFFFFLLAYGLWARQNDPGQLRERGKVAENVKPWDKAIMGAYTVLLFSLFVVSGLDAGRFRWAPAPAVAQIAGWVGAAGAGALVFWVVSVNTYLSRMVRIQDDRGHRVVASGPYRWVRHPMYSGVICLMLCLPLLLGSWWAEVPGALIAVLFVVRTALEDRALQQELEGYREYAARVRFRLLPGVW